MSRFSNESGFYRTQAWKNTRRDYLKSVGGLCERCLRKGLIVPAEIVHHKIPLNESNIGDLSISLCWDNLEALCRKCHAEAHDDIYAERTGRRYKIEDNGKVVIRDDSVF